MSLACDPHYGSATAQAVYEFIRERWERYELHEEYLQYIVTDTTSNMNAAGDLYPCHFHYCVTHVIELTTGIAFTDEHLPGGNNAIKDAHSLVGHFSGSTQATELLLNAQRPSI